MKDNFLKPAMHDLRSGLGEIITILESKAPYGAVSLTSRETTRYLVNNSQKQVSTATTLDPDQLVLITLRLPDNC